MPDLKKQLIGCFHNFFERKRVGGSVYLIALLITSFALFLRLKFFPINSGLQYITFFPAVTLCAIMGGYRAGLFATLIGIGFATYIFTPPYYSISIDVINKSLPGNLIFLFDGIIVSTAIEAMHRYREKNESELELDELNHFFPVKIFFLALFPFAATIVLSVSLLYSVEKNHIESDLKNRDNEAINASVLMIKKQLKSIAFEVNVIKSSPLLMNAIESPTSQNLSILADRFYNFAEANDELLQIRWIDNTGKEKVRIDVQNGKTTIAAQTQLQDESEDYYIKETKDLPVGEIYVSPLDLDTERAEHGEIDKPYHATFRVAVALFDSKNQRQGILILNFHGENFLADVIATVGNRYDQFLLLNSKGYMLHSPNVAEEWGFALDKPNNTLAYNEPEIWADIDAATDGKIRFRGGLWSWKSVYPSDQINNKIKDFSNPSENKERWIAVIYTDKQEITTELNEFTRTLILPIIFLTVLSIALAVWIAKSRYRIEKLTFNLIERTKAAEAANLAKASFLSNMSHEIRTPMNAILGLIFILEHRDLSTEDKSLLHKIRTAGQSLLRIINDVLDVSKIEAGKLDLEVSTFNLNDVLDNLATIMTFNAAEKNIDLIIRPPFGISVNGLIGDSLRLQQVLINLVSNAIKFTSKGHVDVNISIIEYTENSVYLRFSVTDTGVGIPANVQEHIFHPFTQADNSTTRHYGGTGLGLTISRQLIELMGGEITLVSETGKGSEFSFCLRFDYVEIDDTAAQNSSRVDILIADDNEICREALRSITKSLGWTATIVNSGEEALNYVIRHKQERFKEEIIVLDWQMPGMDGLLTAKKIRDELKDAEKKPIVIMVTAYDRKLLVEHPDASIPAAILSKPVTASALYDVILLALKTNEKDGFQKCLSSENQLKRLEGCRLLVVDDSDINLEVASRIFGAEGASIMTANNGQEAVEWLRLQPDAVDLVLMDIQMPVMDGYEATRLIRQIPTLANLPVIALSAGVFKSQIETAHEAGINDFIAKPFDVDVAVTLIRKLSKLAEHFFPRAEQMTQEDKEITRFEESPAPKFQFPGMDIEIALKIWDDAAVYQRYLLKFSTDCEAHIDAIKNSTTNELARLAHKIKGTARMLGLIDIGNAAAELDELVQDGMDTDDAIERLKQAIATTNNSITQYIAEQGATVMQPLERKPFDEAAVAELLTLILRGIEQDSPDGLVAVLEELGTYLTKKCMEPLKLALDAFDFYVAKLEVIKLADEHHVTLGIYDD